MHKRARSSGPGRPLSSPPSAAPSFAFEPAAVPGGPAPAAAAGAARVQAKLRELDAATAAVRAEEQADLEALQRRSLIEQVGEKAAEVEGLRLRLAGVQARKVRAVDTAVALRFVSLCMIL